MNSLEARLTAVEAQLRRTRLTLSLVGAALVGVLFMGATPGRTPFLEVGSLVVNDSLTVGNTQQSAVLTRSGLTVKNDKFIAQVKLNERDAQVSLMPLGQKEPATVSLDAMDDGQVSVQVSGKDKQRAQLNPSGLLK